MDLKRLTDVVKALPEKGANAMDDIGNDIARSYEKLSTPDPITKDDGDLMLQALQSPEVQMAIRKYMQLQRIGGGTDVLAEGADKLGIGEEVDIARALTDPDVLLALRRYARMKKGAGDAIDAGSEMLSEGADRAMEMGRGLVDKGSEAIGGLMERAKGLFR